MAQKMINLRRIELNSKSTQTTSPTFKSVDQQTGENDELYISLSDNKFMHLYNSKSYKDMVLKFNLNSEKSLIITKSMWKLFRTQFSTIDNVLNK
jgi:hypothetical protein